MAGSGLQFLALFILLTYLTRVLTPRDFGLMATLAIGLDLGLRFARWGQIELLQQPQNRTDAIRNHAFWLTMILACGPALLFVLAAWPAGQYFTSPELTIMAYLCAPILLLSAAGSTAEAILRNDFRFKQLAYRNTICTLIGGAVALGMAIDGFGAKALIAQQLIQATLGTIWVWVAVRWRPRHLSTSVFREEPARHGAAIMVGSLLPQLIPRCFDLLTALILGPVALGIMRVANRFTDFVGQVVSIPLIGVANSQMAAIGSDTIAVRASYLRLSRIIATITCPVLIGTGLVAQEAVPLLFGIQWLPSVPIVKTLALLGVIIPVSYYFAAAMIALDQRRIVLRQSIWDLSVGVVAAIIAVNISLQAVAWAIVIRCAYTSICNVIDLRQHLDLPVYSLVRHFAAPYVAVAIMALSVIATRHLFGNSLTDVELLLLLSATGAIVYAATIAAGARVGVWEGHDLQIGRFMAAVLPEQQP